MGWSSAQQTATNSETAAVNAWADVVVHVHEKTYVYVADSVRMLSPTNHAPTASKATMLASNTFVAIPASQMVTYALSATISDRIRAHT